MLSKKEIQILEILQTENDYFITSDEIAELLNCSSKTARKYLKQLSKQVKNHGAELLIKPSKGYCLKINDKFQFKKFFSSIKKQQSNVLKIEEIEDSEDRQYYLLNKLLLENDNVDTYELEEELFVSRPTIMKLIQEIKDRLLPYGLQITTENKKIKIIGAEHLKRKFIVDYFFTKKIDQELLISIGENFFGSELNLNEITIIILEEVKTADLSLSDYVIHNLTLHIALTIKRLKDGFPLEKVSVEDKTIKTREFQVAENIVKRLEEIYFIAIPQEEIKYISIHLITKGTSKKFKGRSAKLKQELRKGLRELNKILRENLEVDEILFEGLLLHFEQLLTRLENKIRINNPLTNDILTDYKYEFKMTKLAFQEISIFNDYTISDEEWAYIVLHILAAKERFANYNKTRVLIVCATGQGSAQMLRNRVEYEFGNLILIKGVISYYELMDYPLDNIDIVISSISLNNLFIPIPVAEVSVLLSKNDIKNIEAKILTRSDVKRKNQLLDTKLLTEKIFEECFTESQFNIFSEQIKKNELIEIMLEQFPESKNSGFKWNFMKELELRELYGPIVFNKILAIPHPAKPLTDKERIGVAICPNGIKWSNENDRVNFVFLVSPSVYANENIKIVSRGLTELLKNSKLQKELLQVTNYKDFKTIFKELINGGN
ncbi:BglG family transcription antiterminator [Dolosigranulum pigrum]|uniref:BglG family transcription antiterminator n=1 Tax=Dolosigranulum pigrum TaxID=29394 RepID=UPI000DBF9BB1|nr:BglG family transcription antiterminator [Dolosigranulum pigrum]RAN60053.1 hypothetical protein B8A46_04605 [Dolosigranulum pigrum]